MHLHHLSQWLGVNFTLRKLSNDEQYFVHVDQDQTNVFMTSDSIDGSSIAGWHHKYGDGRVLCLTPAHLEEGLLHEVFLKVFARSLGWCLLN